MLIFAVPGCSRARKTSGSLSCSTSKISCWPGDFSPSPPLLFPFSVPLLSTCSDALSLPLLYFSLSVPVFSSVPVFGAQWLSPPHCLRSALPIAALSLMCYYRKTQLTGIPYLPTRALASSPSSLPIPLSFSLPQPLPTAEQSANAAAAARPGSSSPLPVSLLSPSLCLLPLYMLSNFIFAVRGIQTPWMN